MNAHGKSIDTTSLRLMGDTARKGYIHRDYLAHCLRYSHVARYMNESTQRGKRHLVAHLLDVGCGHETPLPRLLFSMMMVHSTGSYTGVDYGSVPWPDTIARETPKFHARFIERADFVEVELPRKTFDVVVSLEVLEHVEPLHAFRMLQRMRSVLAADGRAFVSTPCYDAHVGAANNHVNEMSHRGFRALLEAAGFEVERVWGTFASQRDYKDKLDEHARAVFDELSSYYDSGVVACLLAPLVPEYARNCLWRLSGGRPRPIDGLNELAAPAHGSSALWSKHLKQIAKEVAR